jgi:collagen type IV alpha
VTPGTPPAAVPGGPGGGGGGGVPTPPAATPGIPGSNRAATPPTPPTVLPGGPGSYIGPTPGGLGTLIPSAPISDAAGTLPTPPAQLFPAMAQGVATLLSPPQVTIPGIPGFGIPLPSTISMPRDLLCVGTGWSATKSDIASGAPAGALLGSELPPMNRWFDN